MSDIQKAIKEAASRDEERPNWMKKLDNSETPRVDEVVLLNDPSKIYRLAEQLERELQVMKDKS